jgi:hypothetical protein
MLVCAICLVHALLDINIELNVTFSIIYTIYDTSVEKQYALLILHTLRRMNKILLENTALLILHTYFKKDEQNIIRKYRAMHIC